jgi:hypothetical protein
MNSWWQRLVAQSDVRRARRAAWIAGSFIVVLLYALGGLSLYVRKTMLTPSASPTATPTSASVIVYTPTPPLTVTVPTLAPSLTATMTPTLFPTLTPNPPR